MNPSTEQLRARMAAELDELGPMPDVSASAARTGGRILRRRRIAAGSLAGVVGVGGCSLVGAVAAGALPGSGGRVADHPTPRPVPAPDVLPPVPPGTARPTPAPSPRPDTTAVPTPALPALPALPPVQLPEPSPRPGTTAAPTPVPNLPASSPRPDVTAPVPALPAVPPSSPSPR